MKQYIIISIIILCCGISITAQTTAKKDTILQRVMTLEKEYNPNIDKAFKINTLPEIKEPVTTKAKIEFSNYEAPLDIKPEASKLQPEQYFTNLDISKKKGYATLGISSFVDINGDLGYQILNTNKDELSIWGSHRSSWGNVESTQTGEKLKLKLNDNTGAFRYQHNFENLRLFTDAKYVYSGFNYYGIQPETTNISVPEQANNIFDVNTGISSEREGELSYLLKLGYTYFNQKNSILEKIKGPVENTFRANFDVHKSFDDNKLVGLGGYFRGNAYTTPSNNNYTSYKNYSDLNFNPYFKMYGDNWETRLGFKADLLFNYSKDVFFAPDIEFSFQPYDNMLLYLTTKGMVTDNGNNKIFYENRYVNPESRVLDSYTWLDGTIGVKTSIAKVFSMDFFTGYKITGNEHFYSGKKDVLYNRYNNIYTPDYSDAKAFKVGTNLRYLYRDNFSTELKACYYSWNVDDIQKAWNKPQFESDLTVGYLFPLVPLRFDLAYHLETGRKNFVNEQLFKMKDMNDVSLMGTYSFNDTFSVYSRIDNLFNQQYDLWYGYPAEGFRFMGGVSVKF